MNYSGGGGTAAPNGGAVGGSRGCGMGGRRVGVGCAEAMGRYRGEPVLKTECTDFVVVSARVSQVRPGIALLFIES